MDEGTASIGEDVEISTELPLNLVKRRHGCDSCMRTFSSYLQLQIHSRIHTKEKAHSWDIPGNAFSQQCNNINPQVRTHKGPSTYDTGKKKFNCRTSFNREIRDPQGKKIYACELCPKSYTSRQNLTIHLCSHSGERPYVCRACQKTFTHRGALNRHLLIHTGEKPYVCETCRKAFNQRGHLQKHLRIFHTGEYSCDVCHKSFIEKSSLTRHGSIHVGEKPAVTDASGNAFSKQKNLYDHHPIEKPYACELCPKSYTTRQNLTIHLCSHSGERPYVCRACQKTFTYRGTLNRHLLIHTGEKPYVCETCRKAFNQRGHLQKHLRTFHTGEYSCDVCHKSFIEKSSLTRHGSIHVGEKPAVTDASGNAFSKQKNLYDHHSREKPYACDTRQQEFTQQSDFNLRNHMGNIHFAE